MKRSALQGVEDQQSLRCIPFAASYCGQPSSTATASRIHSDPDPDDMDLLLANELNSLSLRAREQVFAEVHGVNEIVEEDPEFVGRCLGQLAEKLDKVSRRSAYDRALFLSPRKVKDSDFRLMFLRADNFDVNKAAKRFVRYFEDKLLVFGGENLIKTITLDDLDESDQIALKTGSIQVLPHKDRAGRSIIILLQEFDKYERWQSQVRYSTRTSEDHTTCLPLTIALYCVYS
jgi:hypothetical protein